jgi:hypothetical protein
MATTFLDPDVFRGAAYRSMVEHLAGPLSAGAADTEIGVDGAGKASVEWSARYPLLVAALRAPADEHGFAVTATLPGPAKRALEFVPYTEAGAFLPVYAPDVDPTTHRATPFDVTFAMKDLGTGQAVPAAQLVALLEVRLIEGVFGRLLFVCGSEKGRIRREGRRLAAMRLLAHARANALDRTGADLGVPRFVDSHQASGQTILDVEADDDYRLRLGVYRPWLRSSRARVLELLNGPGAENDPNAGPLGQLGLAARFGILEEDNPFAVGIELVAAGDDTVRQNFLAFARDAHLIRPSNSAAANAAHAARFLPKARAAREEDLRADLRSLFTFTGDATPDPALAPMLAAALVRAARCRKALGIAGKWEVKRAQKSDGGSRYELGLGVDVVPFTPAELTAMAGNLAAAAADPETRALLDTMTAAAPAQDANGDWLLGKCGLRTVFRVDSTTLYLSHLPVFGLTVSGPTPVAAEGFAIAVPGMFGGSPTSGDLLLYDRSAGEGQFLGVPEGMPTQIALQQNWRKTWSQIVGGRFGGPAREYTDLLFYERASGTVELYDVGEGGAITQLGSDTTSTGWSSIVPCELGKSLTCLFCYDRTKGAAQFFTTDGQGKLKPLGAALGALRRGWTHIVAGDFGGGGLLDLLCLDAAAGQAELFSTDGFGSLVPFADPSWHHGWSHVVAGRFTPGQHDDVVLYDAETGLLDVCSFGDGGTMTTVAHHEDFRRGWTHMNAGDHTYGDAYLWLFAYDRTTGEATWYVTDGQGKFSALPNARGWRKTSAQQFEAHYASEADPDSNIVLSQGVAAAGAAWTAAGNAAWAVRTQGTSPLQQTRWAQAVAPGAAAGVFTAAGLPSVANPAPVVAQLQALPAELVNTLELPAALAGQITGASPAAAPQLSTLLGLLRANGVSSALPLVTSAGAVLLVVSVIGLPQAGINLADQPSTGFRWYSVPIEGPPGTVRTVGARTTFQPAGEGLTALVVVGYARTGLVDPYEYRPELPPNALLDRRQYELLMNLLEYGTPVGVRVNTFAIRKQHVDVNGDGQPDELDPSVTRTYRIFRRRRHLGEYGVSERT